jgi:hypothetical protein
MRAATALLFLVVSLLISSLFIFFLGAFNFGNMVVGMAISFVCAISASTLFLWRDRSIWMWTGGIVSIAVALCLASVLVGAFGVDIHWMGAHS